MQAPCVETYRAVAGYKMRMGETFFIVGGIFFVAVNLLFLRAGVRGTGKVRRTALGVEGVGSGWNDVRCALSLPSLGTPVLLTVNEVISGLPVIWFVYVASTGSVAEWGVKGAEKRRWAGSQWV